MSLLESIDGPRDLDALSEEQLEKRDRARRAHRELERGSGRRGAARVGVARTGEGSMA
ncbi:hypothetical protein [Streptomyces sp. 3N207]|uniref:hypothetical protein n=1 Tax=Streptomyces sp. 3N207 TaxID=3457417 RepID=UPI003FD4C1EC